jgi:predicted ATPase/DNA-binding SARP family transcriptional activator
MARLSLALLGSLQFILDGQPIAGFAYNKARALLAYLAIEAGRPHHRDALIGLLWPDLPDTAARTNLRQVLANLREAVGDAGSSPPFLHITRDTIQFNPCSSYDLDVSAFTALLASCEAHSHRHLERCRSCAVRMGQALALYRGDFLAGFVVGDSAPFEEWQLHQRERLHRQAAGALARLANHHEQRGESERACHYAQRQIELDPWREEAHRQTMRLLARGGQRSAALAQYQVCRQVLARDLGVEPEAQTTALKLSIENEDLRITPTNPADFSILNAQFSIPAPATPLIGRAAELAELGALLENPACRLITIVGPGGIGKTRLALAATAEQAGVFADGVMFVPLQAISAVAFVAPAILSALAIPLQGQRDPREQLRDAVCGKELLLLLDNVEQVLGPEQGDDSIATLLSSILARAAGVTLLITSRERLGMSGEWLFDLSGLSYPAGETTGGFEGYSAVQLFVQRASQVRRQYVLAEAEARAIARICRLVEGLPLAIELAAAWVRLLPSTDIAQEIERNLQFLTSSLHDVPARHRSMQAVFDHSWGLLTEAERRALSKLSVFRGGFTHEAAEQVAGASSQMLAALVDKSLLQHTGRGRYDMHQLVRQYAHAQLRASGEVERTRTDHLLFFLALVEGEGVQSEYLEAFDQLEADHDNVRATLEWGQSHGGPAPQGTGARLAGALGRFWYVRRYWSEGRAWSEAALAADDQAAMATQSYLPALVRARLLFGIGILTSAQGDYRRGMARLEEALALFRTLPDTQATALTLNELGNAAFEQGDYQRATKLLDESLSLFRKLEDQWGIALLLSSMGVMAAKHGDYEHAATLASESLTLCRELGGTGPTITVLNTLSEIAIVQGDYQRATALLEESLAFDRARDNPGRRGAWALRDLGLVAQAQADHRRAAQHFVESLMIRRDLQDIAGIAQCLTSLAEVAEALEQPALAARLWGATEALRASSGASLSLAERVRYERSVAAARAQIDEATFAAAWAAGRAMTLEQAVAYALKSTDRLAK